MTQEQDDTNDILRLRQYIEPALEYASGSHTFEDVCELVAQGRLQLWPGVSSAVLTEVIEYPQYRALNFFLAGGNLAELERMYPVIEAWGRDAKGCTRGVFTGRKGWERTFLARGGWTPTLAVFEKTL